MEIMTNVKGKVPANSVPAAAVIQGELALFVVTRRKVYKDDLWLFRIKN
jgi:hypothetical protein